MVASMPWHTVRHQEPSRLFPGLKIINEDTFVLYASTTLPMFTHLWSSYGAKHSTTTSLCVLVSATQLTLLCCPAGTPAASAAETAVCCLLVRGASLAGLSGALLALGLLVVLSG